MESNHTELFDRAKEAQNNIVEEKRVRYQDGGAMSQVFGEYDTPELIPGKIEWIPNLPSYTVAPHLSGSQRSLTERAIKKIGELVEQGWVVQG